MGWSLAAKIPVAVALLAPVATVLGMFYPLGVSKLNMLGMDELIPMTFGLATLSSVIGGVLTMVFVVNLGYWHLIWIATVGYGLIATLSMTGLKKVQTFNF